MKCLDWKEKISGYIDGEISPEENRLVEEHLENCGSCRALEKRMRALGIGVAKLETPVPPDFREKLFARMESEELLPRRRSLFVYSLRWAALPIAAAAAFAIFLLAGPEKRQDAGTPQPALSQQGTSAEPGSRSAAVPPPAAPAEGKEVASAPLSTEEREIVAHLDVFEDPGAIEDQGEVDATEIFESAGARKG